MRMQAVNLLHVSYRACLHAEAEESGELAQLPPELHEAAIQRRQQERAMRRAQRERELAEQGT